MNGSDVDFPLRLGVPVTERLPAGNLPRLYVWQSSQNVVFVFYDEDNIAEIYIRKHISAEDKLSVFEKLNFFNSKYRGMSFFLDNEMVCVKSYCATGGDIQIALLMLAKNMETAQELFAEFV